MWDHATQTRHASKKQTSRRIWVTNTGMDKSRPRLVNLSAGKGNRDSVCMLTHGILWWAINPSNLWDIFQSHRLSAEPDGTKTCGPSQPRTNTDRFFARGVALLLSHDICRTCSARHDLFCGPSRRLRTCKYRVVRASKERREERNRERKGQFPIVNPRSKGDNPYLLDLVDLPLYGREKPLEANLGDFPSMLPPLST